MTGSDYQGSELEIFAEAHGWKRYLRALLAPWLAGDVLEVGAGIGATTSALVNGAVRRWICLEPDRRMAARLAEQIAGGGLPAVCTARAGVLAEVPPSERFDTILYIDVLEHIERDADELVQARDHLRPGGRLVILAPAHPWLYTKFDRNIGHHRRYTKRSLAAVVPPGTSCERLWYVDAAGLAASLANRFVLRSGMPSPGQVRFWDRALVPVSRILDRALAHGLGKSVLGVWRTPDRGATGRR